MKWYQPSDPEEPGPLWKFLNTLAMTGMCWFSVPPPPPPEAWEEDPWQ